MNPVDHPHGVCDLIGAILGGRSLTQTRVVIINISVRPLRSRDTLHKVKRLVSLLLGELVCCVVLRRSRTKWVEGLFIASDMLAMHLCTCGMEHRKLNGKILKKQLTLCDSFQCFKNM